MSEFHLNGSDRRAYARPTGRRVGLGRVQQVSTSALNAPSPKTGEVRHTALPDTFDGIRFEIGRMIRYVQDSAQDPVVQQHVDELCEQYRAAVSMNGPIQASENAFCVEAIDAWCRDHFVYVNDPPNVEVIQTPRRMIKQTKMPKDVLRSLLAPFFDAFSQAVPSFNHESYTPPDMYIGDCDEAGCAMLGMCACKKVEPLEYRFGGNDGTLHHVWGYVGVDGKMVDTDHTEPDYKLGQHSSFEAFETVRVPL